MIAWIIIVVGVLFAFFILLGAITIWMVCEGFKARDEEALKIIEQENRMKKGY